MIDVAVFRSLVFSLAFAISASPAFAQDEAEQSEPGPLISGECAHPSREVTTWLYLLDSSGVGSISCKSARVDWDSSIIFYRDAEGKQIQSHYRGKRSGDHALQVDTIEELMVRTVDVIGTCRMILPEFVGPRQIKCLSQNDREEYRVMSLVDFTFADPVFPAEGLLEVAGECVRTSMAKPVILPMVIQKTGKMTGAENITSVSCGKAVIEVGRSYRFLRDDGEGEIVFEGEADAEDPSRIVVNRITLESGTTHQAIAGTCLTQRADDGFLVPACFAAIGPTAAPILFEAAMVPDGSSYRWPARREDEQ